MSAINFNKVIQSNMFTFKCRIFAYFTVIFWATFTLHSAHAEPGSVKGTVKYIRTHDAQLPQWAPPAFWFALKDVSAGNCPKWNGNVLFVGRDRAALAMVLAAQVGNLEIQAGFDDAILVNGWCLANGVTTGNPAPTF